MLLGLSQGKASQFSLFRRPRGGASLVGQHGLYFGTARTPLLTQPGASACFLAVAATDDADPLSLPVEWRQKRPKGLGVELRCVGARRDDLLRCQANRSALGQQFFGCARPRGRSQDAGWPGGVSGAQAKKPLDCSWADKHERPDVGQFAPQELDRCHVFRCRNADEWQGLCRQASFAQRLGPGAGLRFRAGDKCQHGRGGQSAASQSAPACCFSCCAMLCPMVSASAAVVGVAVSSADTIWASSGCPRRARKINWPSLLQLA